MCIRFLGFYITFYLMSEQNFQNFQNTRISELERWVIIPSFYDAAGTIKEYSFGAGCTYVADEIPGTYSV